MEELNSDLNIVNNRKEYELNEDVEPKSNRKMSKEMDENIPPSIRYMMKSVFNELKTKFYGSNDNLSVDSEEKDSINNNKQGELNTLVESVQSESISITTTLNQFECSSNLNDYKIEKAKIEVEDIKYDYLQENYNISLESLTHLELNIPLPFQNYENSEKLVSLKDTDSESGSEVYSHAKQVGISESNDEESFGENDSTSSSFDLFYPLNSLYDVDLQTKDQSKLETQKLSSLECNNNTKDFVNANESKIENMSLKNCSSDNNKEKGVLIAEIDLQKDEIQNVKEIHLINSPEDNAFEKSSSIHESENEEKIEGLKMQAKLLANDLSVGTNIQKDENQYFQNVYIVDSPELEVYDLSGIFSEQNSSSNANRCIYQNTDKINQLEIEINPLDDNVFNHNEEKGDNFTVKGFKQDEIENIKDNSSNNSPEFELYVLSTIFSKENDVKENDIQNTASHLTICETSGIDEDIYDLSLLFTETDSEEILNNDENLVNNDLKNLEIESLNSLITSKQVNLVYYDDFAEALEAYENSLNANSFKDINHKSFEMDTSIEAAEEVKGDLEYLKSYKSKKQANEMDFVTLSRFKEDVEYSEKFNNSNNRTKLLSVSLPNINMNQTDHYSVHKFASNEKLNFPEKIKGINDKRSISYPNLNKTRKHSVKSICHSVKPTLQTGSAPIESLQTMKSIKQSSSNSSIETMLTCNKKTLSKKLKNNDNEEFKLETCSLNSNNMYKTNKFLSNFKSSSYNDLLYRKKVENDKVLDTSRKISLGWNRLSVLANSRRSKILKSDNFSSNEEFYDVRSSNFIPQASEECIFEFKSIKSMTEFEDDNFKDCEPLEEKFDIINLKSDIEKSENIKHINIYPPQPLKRTIYLNNNHAEDKGLNSNISKDKSKTDSLFQEIIHSDTHHLSKNDIIVTQQPRSVMVESSYNQPKKEKPEDFKSKVKSYFCCCKNFTKQ